MHVIRERILLPHGTHNDSQAWPLTSAENRRQHDQRETKTTAETLPIIRFGSRAPRNDPITIAIESARSIPKDDPSHTPTEVIKPSDGTASAGAIHPSVCNAAAGSAAIEQS